MKITITRGSNGIHNYFKIDVKGMDDASPEDFRVFEGIMKLVQDYNKEAVEKA